MNPQLKSVLTSIALAAASAAAAWGVSKGLVPASDQSGLENALVTLATIVAGALVTWFKARQNSQQAMITAVNTQNNGVKVVDEKAPVPMVTGPLNGAAK